MGSHGADVTVYGPTRLRFSAPLLVRPGSIYASWTVVFGACAGAALLTRRPWLPGLVLVGVAVVVVVLVIAGHVAQPRVVLTDRAHLNKWPDVERWCAVVRRTWPQISGMTGIKDAAPVVNHARWDLARLIVERGRLSGVRSQAKFAEYGLDPDDPLRDELASRRDQLDARLAAMDIEIAGRVKRLQSLAEHCAHFAHVQATASRAPRVARRAQHVVERADSVILSSTGWEARADPAAELSERTEAVLAAYRELTAAPEALQ